MRHPFIELFHLSNLLHLPMWSEVKVAQLCLWNPMDYRLPGSSVHGILQARTLEWAGVPFSRGSSQPRDRIPVSHIAGRFFTVRATSEVLNAKERSNYCTIALISNASKVMLKILQARDNMWTKNFQMFKLDLEKAEEPEIELPTSTGSQKSKRIPEKHLLQLYWLCQSLWLCRSQQNVENS